MAISKKNKNKNPLSMVTKCQNLGGERGIIITLWGGLINSNILLRKCNIVVPKQFWHKLNFFFVLPIF
jgi:hypothetical protein